jgi:TolA-binding protein
MKNVIGCVVWGALLISVTGLAAERISLAVGERKALQVGALRRVATGDPTVADVSVKGGGIEVSGVATGRTSLLVWTADGKQVDYEVVVGKPPEAAAPEPAPAPAGAGADGARFLGERIEKATCVATGNPALKKAQEQVKQKDYDAAIVSFRAALAKEPALAFAYRGLGTALAKQGKVAEASRAYETFVLSCPAAVDAPRVRKILDDYQRAR